MVENAQTAVSYIHEITGIAVDIVVIVGAIAAAVRFRLFNILGYRWRTELHCSHVDLPGGSVIFVADYVVSNTGRRPLHLTTVRIRLTGAAAEGPLLVPDESRVIATRVLHAGDKALRGIFQIEPGERTIFTLRARLPELDEEVFVLCDFSTAAQRTPTSYRGFYVKSQPGWSRNEMAKRTAGSEEDGGVS
jgi:hypothetical protein